MSNDTESCETIDNGNEEKVETSTNTIESANDTVAAECESPAPDKKEIVTPTTRGKKTYRRIKKWIEEHKFEFGVIGGVTTFLAAIITIFTGIKLSDVTAFHLEDYSDKIVWINDDEEGTVASGFIVEDGANKYIYTAYHIASESLRIIQFGGEKKTIDVSIGNWEVLPIFKDGNWRLGSNRPDIARHAINLDNPDMQALPAFRLERSTNVRRGEKVWVVGVYKEGDRINSKPCSIDSYDNENIYVSYRENEDGKNKEANVFEWNGMSGAPILSSKGKVIGVHARIEIVDRPSEGITTERAAGNPAGFLLKHSDVWNMVNLRRDGSTEPNMKYDNNGKYVVTVYNKRVYFSCGMFDKSKRNQSAPHRSEQVAERHDEYLKRRKEHFEKASKLANEGNVDGKIELGLCYLEAIGTSRDAVMAFKLFKEAAESGNVRAKFYLANCYFYGTGTKVEKKLAIALYKDAAEKGDTYAQDALGYCYAEGLIGEVNKEEALKWWHLAAKTDAVTQYMLGDYYMNGYIVNRDPVVALQWLEKAASNKSGNALKYLGDIYSRCDVVARDTDKANEYYKRALAAYKEQAKEIRDHNAKYMLWMMYDNGLGVKEDDKQAKEWLWQAVEEYDMYAALAWSGQESATDKYHAESIFNNALRPLIEEANNGSVYAQVELASIYSTHEIAGKTNWTEAAKWWYVAATNGEVTAQYNYGVCCEYGDGRDVDLKEAVKWYRESAINGFALAQFRYAECCRHGIGRSKDIEEAARWCYMAAINGYDVAQLHYADYCMKGLGRIQDYKESAKWWYIAATNGNANAQYNYGVCCEHGDGRDVDLKEAVKWYRESAINGFALAQFRYAECCRHGIGRSKDIEEAARWCYMAAINGYDVAQLHYADYCMKGIGRIQDYKEAAEWWYIAATNGNANAQYNYGVCCENGDGRKLNLEEAAKWYHEAASNGFTQAQFRYAEFCEKGIGRSKDAEEAAVWYSKAAEQGIEK